MGRSVAVQIPVSQRYLLQSGRRDFSKFWEDPWIPNNPGFIPKPNNTNSLNTVGMVNSLKQLFGEWNENYLLSLFDHSLIDNIKSMFWAKHNQRDKIIWLGSRTGAFSVKSAYSLEEGIAENGEEWWKFVWHNHFHERAKFFLWKLSHGGLPTMDNLASRGILVESQSCVHGCESSEHEVHIFFLCEVAKRMWFASPWSIRWELLNLNTLPQYLNYLMNPEGKLPVHTADKENFFLFSLVILEQLWWLRNRVAHKEDPGSMESSMLSVWNRIQEFKHLKIHDSISSSSKAIRIAVKCGEARPQELSKFTQMQR